MRMLLLLLSIVCFSAPASAGQSPLIEPVPEWVRPVQLPTQSTGSAGGSAIELLLIDQQVLLRPGERTIYFRSTIRLQTPQGLAAGNISIPWRPETDDLIVHRLAIRRGNEIIDVLASQTFTVLRRETNLESAMLDGVLTANIQPEGLEVGDIIDMEVSTIRRDPVFAGQVEFTGAAWNGVPIARAHFRAQWPTSLQVRLGGVEKFPRLNRSEQSGITTIEVSADDLQPVIPPAGAPARFSMGRFIDLSSFQSWSDIAALLTPHYERAAVIPAQGPLRVELDRIAAQSTDPVVRTEAALALVQNRVRYVALAMGDGGLVPTDATTTWSRRYGDCKAKTTLLVALLNALGVDAAPVAVNSFAGDGLTDRLPMISMFDHVIVRAVIDGRVYWLDGTRAGDRRLASLSVHPFGWGLPLVLNGAELTAIQPPTLDRPTEFMTVSVDASRGFSQPAPARVEMEITGDDATAIAQILDSVAGERRDQLLRDYWRARLRSIEPSSYSAAIDQDTGVVRLTVEGTTQMSWSDGRYRTSGTGFYDDPGLERDPGAGSDAPFAVAHPYFIRNVHRITLPSDATGFSFQPASDVETIIAGVEYRRRSTIESNVAIVDSSQRSVVSEFPASEAPAARTALQDLSSQTVYLVQPPGYRPSQEELTSVQQSTEGTARDFLSRGNILLDNRRYPEAIAQFDRAIAAEPRNESALASRGITYVWQGDLVRAQADLDAAAVINDRNPVIFRARGLMALQKEDYRAAVDAFTTAHQFDRDDTFALYHRSLALAELGDTERALADVSAVIDRQPTRLDLYANRAGLLNSAGKREDAVDQARIILVANPNSADAHMIAGGIYDAFGRRTDALREFGLAMAQRADVSGFLSRAHARAPDDVAGRRSDIDAAIGLDPASVPALAALAALEEELGNHDAAIAAWDSVVATTPERDTFKVRRGMAYLRAGRNAEAERDFAAARGDGQQASIFNTMCWEKAKAGIALESAVEDCTTALRLDPDSSAYLDSRGLANLRLGRLDAAVADFDRALVISPHLPASLFGRAVARALQGNAAGSRADLEAAERELPDIRRRYARYGVTLPDSD